MGTKPLAARDGPFLPFFGTFCTGTVGATRYMYLCLSVRMGTLLPLPARHAGDGAGKFARRAQLLNLAAPSYVVGDISTSVLTGLIAR
jgi:hypothetical protein